jgi:hypothetical protein
MKNKQQNEINSDNERKFLFVFVGLCLGALVLSFCLSPHAALVLCRVVLGFLGAVYAYAAWYLWLD